MNQKKNTKILLILIIIIVIIILAGVGILVFATDIFKSDKEMFFKYMADIGDSKKGFIDDGLKQYFEKRITHLIMMKESFLLIYHLTMSKKNLKM